MKRFDTFMEGVSLPGYMAVNGVLVACGAWLLMLLTGSLVIPSPGSAVAGGVGGAIGAGIYRARRERRLRTG